MRKSLISLCIAACTIRRTFQFIPSVSWRRHDARMRIAPSHGLLPCVPRMRIAPTHGLRPLQHPIICLPRHFWASRHFWARSNDDEEDSDEEIDLSDQDWRTFRAKLVMGEPPANQSSSSLSSNNVTLSDGDLDGIGALFEDEQAGSTLQLTPLDPSQWAYDSGTVIEQGAVILGGVEQDYGFGLRQQYFHKAAILVLDHDESFFTKGIILNRPTDLTLDDDVNPGVKWRVWYGGDVQGISSDTPDIICLHSLRDAAVTKASIPVMKDIQWTSFDAAKKLVKAGAAKPTDFWLFCGYAGWGAKQLMGELQRKSWYMVATDSQTLLKELARQSAGADPRDAGLETWTLLMNMIGRSSIADENAGGFDDLMLKEWALKHLLSVEAGGGAGARDQAVGGLESTQDLEVMKPVDRLIKRVAAVSLGEAVMEGTVVRASSKDRSPFLLEGQELHKSLVLVLSDDERLSIGVILNRPGSKGLEIQVQEKGTGSSKQLKVPLRYGGQYAIKGNQPLLWLHCNPVLKSAKIGTPVGSADGIWKCTSSDMISAVSQALAMPEDFLVVSGVSIWTKGSKGVARGIQGEIRVGRFEIVPESQISSIWEELLKQDVLTEVNLVKNLIIAGEAWNKAAMNGKSTDDSVQNPPLGGLGEGFDEEDDSFVFKSDVKVSKLSDDALRSWVATFLLGSPSLGE
jgi:putative AlgH/UPF0301 family transcriptional regulator